MIAQRLERQSQIVEYCHFTPAIGYFLGDGKAMLHTGYRLRLVFQVTVGIAHIPQNLDDATAILKFLGNV
jgi:hypothetical protein